MFMHSLGNIFFLFRRIYRRILYYIMKPRFKACGFRLKFCPNDSDFSYNTISLGDDVHIGPRASFLAPESQIIIGNQVMFGPNVSIVGGNHNIDKVGFFMHQVRDKNPGDDQDINIEHDVWIGTNVTILKGVSIGRGSVIAAGSIVTKSFPPYAIIGGVPARLIRWRWPIETIVRHENQLYPSPERISPETLHSQRNAFEPRKD